jgi:hypothetical protein
MSKRRSKSSKKRTKRSAVAGTPALEWASDHRYQLAAGAVGVAALVYFWPRSAEATQLPPPAPAGPPPITLEQAAQIDADRQRDLGMKIGVAAFALVAAGTIYYVTK